MTEKASVVKNTQVLNRYFPAYKKYFGYTSIEEPLSIEDLENRKQKLFGWVEQTLPIINEIHQYITKSEQNASVFLPYYNIHKQQITQSRQRIPFHNFTHNIMRSCVSCRQSIQIQPDKNQQMRRQIITIKNLLDKLHTKHTVPRQQLVFRPQPSQPPQPTRKSYRISSKKLITSL